MVTERRRKYNKKTAKLIRRVINAGDAAKDEFDDRALHIAATYTKVHDKSHAMDRQGRADYRFVATATEEEKKGLSEDILASAKRGENLVKSNKKSSKKNNDFKTAVRGKIREGVALTAREKRMRKAMAKEHADNRRRQGKEWTPPFGRLLGKEKAAELAAEMEQEESEEEDDDEDEDDSMSE